MGQDWRSQLAHASLGWQPLVGTRQGTWGQDSSGVTEHGCSCSSFICLQDEMMLNCAELLLRQHGLVQQVTSFPVPYLQKS